MLLLFASETFKEFPVDSRLRMRYAVSNYGRILSFTDKIEEGRILKGSSVDGYRVIRFKVKDENSDKIINLHKFVYKLVAYYFVPRTSEDQMHVIHLDRQRDNDHESNLKWVTKEEMLAHFKSSPRVIEAKRKLVEHNLKSDGKKLTVSQVMLLKKRLQDPERKTRLKILAKQFGISEMQLHRIKTGENWGHIKV